MVVEHHIFCHIVSFLGVLLRSLPFHLFCALPYFMGWPAIINFGGREWLTVVVR